MDLKDPKNKNQLCTNIATFSTKQQNYLTRQVNEDYHRAAVLYYGLHSQFVKLKNEKTYHTNNKGKFIALKRGSIIKIDFGLPLGSEFGGLHYAIVLHDSNVANPLVTVLPIKSFKGDNYHKTDIIFDAEIYEPMREQLSIAKSIRRHRIKAFRNLLITKNHRVERLFELAKREGFALDEKSFDLLGVVFYGSPELRKALKESQFIKKEDLQKEHERILRQNDNVEISAAESKKFQRQSIGITSQIRSLSKMRIYFPTNRFDPLYNIRVSKKTLLKINSAIKSYYL